jgi:hypothetical protein
MVLSRVELAGRGVTRDRLRAQLAANRWQRCGAAIVLHNGPLTRDQRWQVGLVNVGPRSMLTAFTAAELLGLQGWEREEVHVLAPPGTSSRAVPGLRIRLHRTRSWPPAADPLVLRCQPAAAAIVLAAGTFTAARAGCGILAAAVQQRIAGPEAIERSLLTSTRLRHRAVLIAAVRDMAGGSQALSDIDLVRLCRRYGLPEPIRQLARPGASGRRRYLEASWRRHDGRLVVAEVDGALHLSQRQWWADEIRQDELMIGGAVVLRFPSAVVRTEPRLVVAQLRRVLLRADREGDGA